MSESAEVGAKAGSEWPRRILMGIGVAAAIYAYQNWDSVSVQLFGASAYTCTNLVQQVVQVSEKSTTILQPKVIGVIDPKLVSKTAARIECTGTGVFANGMKTTISYRAYEEGGQWWVFYEGKP
ncbi:hypothetical protein G6M02_14165 [Agrobacterium rhizogenes]|nr:hypothetical protein [Rhizobium rhizogenes]